MQKSCELLAGAYFGLRDYVRYPARSAVAIVNMRFSISFLNAALLCIFKIGKQGASQHH
jgi:threonine dehydrogenase-like Zn-dependent dehydrogenase